jgi:GTP cyclohydrolase IA
MTAFPAPGQPFDAARVRAAREERGVDTRAIEAAVLALLHAIGEDPARPGLEDTPARVARAWVELSAGYREDPRRYLEEPFNVEDTHPNAPREGPPPDAGLVLQSGIPFWSLCEHHLLPFYGTAAVAYLPNQRLVGLSKLARLVRGYAARLQMQERLTGQIADALFVEPVHAIGVAVVLKAEHLCLGMRGVKAPGSLTVTSALRGVFFDDPRARDEVMQLIAN